VGGAMVVEDIVAYGVILMPSGDMQSSNFYKKKKVGAAHLFSFLFGGL
jgi:hypothetical protein